MEAPQISPPPEKISQNSGRASVSSQLDVHRWECRWRCRRRREGTPTPWLNKGPSVMDSRRHHWGCGIVLAEPRMQRWQGTSSLGSVGSCFQPSGSQIAAGTPVGGISCIPESQELPACCTSWSPDSPSSPSWCCKGGWAGFYSWHLWSLWSRSQEEGWSTWSHCPRWWSWGRCICPFSSAGQHPCWQRSPRGQSARPGSPQGGWPSC